MQALLEKAEKLENLIAIYSTIDRERMAQLEAELKAVNLEILELMSEEA